MSDRGELADALLAAVRLKALCAGRTLTAIGSGGAGRDSHRP